MNDNGMSPSDVRAVVDASNGGYAYPPYPYMGGYGGGFGNGFGSGDWSWILLLVILCGGFGNGFGGGFGGFGGFGNEYAWLSNGQKEIMQNTNDGFNTLQLANQLTQANTGIQNLSTQLCNSTSDIVASVNGGFANAETAANARQMANMQQAFNNQLSTVQGFNNISSQFADCCCENRLATCQTQNIIQNEGNATRFADANNTRDIITNQTQNTQAILDKLCQLELDGKNDKINDLERQLTLANLKASQTEQNAFIAQGFSNEVDALYNRLSSCPVPSTPVFRKNSDF